MPVPYMKHFRDKSKSNITLSIPGPNFFIPVISFEQINLYKTFDIPKYSLRDADECTFAIMNVAIEKIQI